ncbi:hypothetical protein [Rickettsiella endosymbiont of Dermanyssus gallinae]|uniref:hypothetical protein n=1 Tax=Rickettsiella endosymbiont of Dermanyssus gallinae TaxID=2856608 RepID=UPI001C52DEE0|nr:hypothetical protein [Rickettsiella endosymbiont of Dermanyssus gallinae]
MIDKNNKYSLRKDINKKTLVSFDLNRELEVIRKLMHVFSQDEKSEKIDALIQRESTIRDRQKTLKHAMADMSFFEKIISYCSSGIYLASIIHASVENNNFNKYALVAVYEKIISLVTKESSNCQSFIDAKFLQFFENTALDYTGGYEPVLQR